MTETIERAVLGRGDVVLSRHPLSYRAGSWELLRVASARIASDDDVLLIQAGIHGDEIAGPIALATQLGPIFDRAGDAGIKLIIYPLANPSGFELGSRYNADQREAPASGNNDFLRYELEDGRIADEVPVGGAFRRWIWSSDPSAGATLPAETALLHTLLARDPLDRVRAALDLHQDRITPGAPPAAYHYAFGELARYASIVSGIEQLIPLWSDRVIEAGYGQGMSAISDARGFLVRHDGSFGDLFHRLGAEHAITVETTGATPLELACWVNMCWIDGLIALLRR